MGPGKARIGLGAVPRGVKSVETGMAARGVVRVEATHHACHRAAYFLGP